MSTVSKLRVRVVDDEIIVTLPGSILGMAPNSLLQPEGLSDPGRRSMLRRTKTGDQSSCKGARAGACSICPAPTNARWRRPGPFPPTR